MKIARHRRAGTLAIVDATLSDVSKLSERTLYYSSNSPAFVRSHTGLLSILQALAYGVYARDTASVRRPHPRVPPEVACAAVLGLPDGITACLFDLDGVLTEHGGGPRAGLEADVRGCTASRHVRRARRLRPLRRRQAARGRDPRLPRLARRPPGRATRSRKLGDEQERPRPAADPRRRASRPTRARAATWRRRESRPARAPSSPRATTPRRCSRSTGLDRLHRGARRRQRQATSSACAASPRRTRSSRARSGSACAPDQAAVFEDALAGRRGRAAPGSFGHVVGVDRVGQREALLEHGADVVVDDLAELL